MKKVILLLAILIPTITFSQIATEANIPFLLDTDGDTIPNVIDADDDGDGVLDNLDAFPLDATKSTPTIVTSIVTTIADAGIRSTATTTNYGTATEVLTRNTNTRSFFIKFNRPLGLNLASAMVTIFTNTENDPLDIHLLSNNSWLESTVTFDNADTTNTFLGTTTAPVGGKYTFSIPTNSLPASGDFTIWVHDNTNEASTETLYTREFLPLNSKAATIDFNYYPVITPKLVIDQSTGTTGYLAGADIQVGFKLNQAPTSTVYIPVEILDPTKAEIVDNKVLTFTTTNWSVNQTLLINPLAIGTFNIAIRPLHGDDVFYNGHNENDLLNYTIQATNITNLGPWNATTGSLFTTTLTTVSAVGSTAFTYKIISGPVGMGIVENSGKINFTPLSSQVGTFPVTIEVKDDKGNISKYITSIVITSSGMPDPIGIYVVPYAAVNGTGTAASPFNNIPAAVAAAASANIENVYVRGGNYNLLDVQFISTAASATNPVTIQPAPGEIVKFDFGVKGNAFEFQAASRHLTFKNFEIDGGTDNVDFWCLPAQAFWGDKTVFRGGGIAIGVNGENITIQGNYIHNCYQKAVEIRTARYLKVYDNIIHSIATTSLSGGHGIMRQQASGPVIGNDNGVDFRWDIMGNLIFNVEQRIYSWVPSKGFIDMVLDEGKPILIDDVSDAPAVAASMKARIRNNVVAYGAIDQIRLKSTNNLTVSNNTVYSAAPAADGITDKVADPGNSGKFSNTTLTNNAVQTMPGTAAFELADIQTQGNATIPATINNNYAAVGNITPDGISGVSSIAAPMFVNPNDGNFNLASGVPAGIGASPAALATMDVQKNKFAVNVKWGRWDNNHLKLTQTILDNNPGVNDGIVGNESVLTNAGILHLNALPARSEIDFDIVIPSVWYSDICACPTKTTEKFELHPDYAAWYKARNAATKNAIGNDYERIRWGESVLKQNQLFDNDWLTNSQIWKADSNTVIYGKDNNFIVDGDLLVDFEGYTPVAGDKWYLMKAKTITTANTSNPILFDRVLFEGATLTPSQYTLTIVDIPGGQALQLLIVNNILPISLINFTISKNDCEANLNWLSGTESNFKHYEFEYSTDGITFIKVNTIIGKGSNNNYTVTHFPNVGKAYYRLKLVDMDGSFSNSKIVSGTFCNKLFTATPNPVTNEVTITGLNGKGTINIFTTDGKLMYSVKVTTTSLKLNVQKLKTGVFLLKYIDEEDVQVMKLFKQ
jgi:hypothetical protein